MVLPGNLVFKIFELKKYLREIICRKLKELRRKHGFSQLDVSVGLNIEQNTYSRLERGETKLDIERLQQIALFYNISIHDLLDAPPPRIIFKKPSFENQFRLRMALISISSAK